MANRQDNLRRPQFLSAVPDARAVTPAPFAAVPAAAVPRRPTMELEAERASKAEPAAPPPPAPAPRQASPFPAAPPAPRPPPPAPAPEPQRPVVPAAPPPEMLERLSAAVQTLAMTGRQLAEQARSDVLELAFQIARKILESEVRSSPEPLFALVRSALNRVGDTRQVSVRLSPADAQIVEQALNTGSFTGVTVAKVKVLPDPSLERGDCMVDSDFATIDGRLSTRLAELRAAVAQALEEDAA